MRGAPPRPASGDSLPVTGKMLSAAAGRMAALDVARRAARVSIDLVCVEAEISAKTYNNALTGRHAVRPSTIARIEQAIRSLSAGLPRWQADEQRLIRATYDAHLAFLCARRGQPVRATREALQAGSAADRRERERIRQAARYLANTHLGLTQSALARALGLSKVAVHLALKTIEDLRDDPAWDRLLAEAEGSIGERG